MTTTVSSITFQTIDESTSEGKMLQTAVCLIGFLKFRDKKPQHILEVLKDIQLHPFVDEPLEVTMTRIIDKFKSDNN